MMNSKISVIIATYNSSHTLEDAITSVLNQSYKNYELLVIDGASTDNTVDIIRKYEKNINYWISEKDSGIADAWNKGIKKSTGDIICLLNSDDILYCENFTIINNECIDSNTIYYGTCYNISNNNIASVNNKSFNKNNLLQGFGFTHTTVIVHKKIYESIGLFNTDCKIALDTDFLLRAYISNIKFEKISHKVYMRTGGVSDKYFFKAYCEYLNLLKKYSVYSNKIIQVYKFIYFILLPLRKIKRSKVFLDGLKSIKHFSVYLSNSLFSFLFLRIMRFIYFKARKFEIGKSSSIIGPVKFYRNDHLTIGNNSCINRNCLIDNRGFISIGSNVSIAHNCSIYTAGHEINSPFFEIKIKDVKIKDYAVIFANVMIMPGITINEGVVILPGSVVTKDVLPYEIVGGNPANKIGNRNKDLRYSIDYDYWMAL